MSTNTSTLGTRKTRSSVISKTKDAQPEMASEGTEKTGGEGESISSLITMMGKMMMRIDENNRKEMAENRKQQKELSEMYQKSQEENVKALEAQRMSSKTPLPKYSGKPGEFDDWKQNVTYCIKCNNWTDEQRVLDMIPSSLTGQAQRVFRGFNNKQKESLDAIFNALKDMLEPEGKALNRELFVKAKRNPGETMKAFISRCNQYVARADEIDNGEDSLWAKPFIIEKIYTNLNASDRKLLKAIMGKSEDVQLLNAKADELISLSEDVVGSLSQYPQTRGWQSQPPRYQFPNNGNRRGNYGGWRPRGRGSQRSQGWQNNQLTNTHNTRPGGPQQPRNNTQFHNNRASRGQNWRGQKQRANGRQPQAAPGTQNLN